MAVSAPDLQYLDNIIYLPREPTGRYLAAYMQKKGWPVLMYVTYGDLFTFVIMLCTVITLVYKHKK